MHQRLRSQKMYEDFCQYIPGGVNSPVRAFKGLQRTPMIVAHGMGDVIWDVDGNEYIDYCGSWGALVHGHAHPKIIASITLAAQQGTSFGITCEAEGVLAKKIVDKIPGVEKLRFVSSGTEATMSALRLARGFTNKPYIVKFSGNYHGHADFLLVQAGSGVTHLSANSTSAGIPQAAIQHTICLPYNDIEALQRLFADCSLNQQIAAVILEPCAGNMGVVKATAEFLRQLRTLTANHGSLLIFDEVMSGFRVGPAGVAGECDFTADLLCFGKIIGGGLPAAAFGGKSEIMDCLAPLGSVYQAGTLSGNPLAMHAGITALDMLSESGVYESLAKKTLMITERVSKAFKRNGVQGCVQQAGSMFTVFFGAEEVVNGEQAKALDAEAFCRFFNFMFDNGVYIPPLQQEAWFVSTVHTEEHLHKTVDLIEYFLDNHKF